jgi:hypothetical protein
MFTALNKSSTFSSSRQAVGYLEKRLDKFFSSASLRRAFIVTLVFVTLSAALFWLDFFRSYRAEMAVLVVSKTAVSSQDATENAAELVRTLAFYERVLADNDLIDDNFVGYAPDQRKALWNDTVFVKRRAESSVLTVRARGETPEKAKRLAKQTAQTLFATMSFYYNIKTEMDMRVIDGPLVSYTLTSPFLFGATSIVTGFSITLLFFWFLNTVSGFVAERKPKTEKIYPEFALGETVPWIDPRKFIPAKPMFSFKNAFPETSGAPEASVSQYVAHAPAPANLPIAPIEMELPIADESTLPLEFETPPQEYETMFSSNQGELLGFPVRGEHNIQPQSVSPELQRSEPTNEEYKRRLNELLSGGK